MTRGAAVGDQRRRHVVRELQPRHQPAPGLPGRAPRPSGTSATCATPAPDEDGQTGFFWCARDRRGRRRVTASSGAGPSTSAGRASTTRTPPTATARPSARSPLGHAVPRGAGHLGQRRRVHAVRRVLHRQREHAGQHLRTFSGSQPVPGWFGIGGTSLSSPLWSAITADRDSYRATAAATSTRCCTRCSTAPGRYFHDITGIGPAQQAATNNGLFPTTPGYDEATGIGTPRWPR